MYNLMTYSVNYDIRNYFFIFLNLFFVILRVMNLNRKDQSLEQTESVDKFMSSLPVNNIPIY